MVNSFSLSFAAADMAGELLDVNLRRYPLQFPYFGELIEDRQRIAQACMADLHQRGLARNGRLNPEVEETLQLVDRFELAIVVLGSAGERNIFARLSAAGRQAVLVTRQDQHLRFTEIRPESLAYTAVGLLPDLKPVRGSSVTIKMEEPKPKHQRVEDNEEREFFQPVRGGSGDDAKRRAFEAMSSAPMIGAGFFIVSARDDRGKEYDLPGLSWYDTEEGRYMVQAHDGANGGSSGTFTPADSRRLLQQLGQLLEQARQG